MIRSFRSLQIFVTVAEELHFRKAAERLHMSQPPLSLQIRQLEDTIGVELFSRTTRSVQLTPAGKELYRRATRFLAELDAMREAVRSVGCGTVGSLSLGFPASTMFDILPRLLEVQRSRYPKVSLNLQELPSTELLEALRSRRLDAALVRATPAAMSPDLDHMVVTDEALLLALPVGHPLARLRCAPLQALHDAPFVGYAADRSRYLHDLVRSLSEQYGIRPNQVQESVLPTILGLVEARIGIALVPESLARLRTQTITYRPLTGMKQPLTVPLYCAWRRGDVPAPVKGFIEILEQSRSSSAPGLRAAQAVGRSRRTESLAS